MPDPLSQSQCQFPNKEYSACFHSNAEWSLTQCWPFTFWKCSGHHWRLNVCLWRPESSQEGKGSREPRRRWSLSWQTKTWNTWRRTLAMMKRRYESGSGGTWRLTFDPNLSQNPTTRLRNSCMCVTQNPDGDISGTKRATRDPLVSNNRKKFKKLNKH